MVLSQDSDQRYTERVRLAENETVSHDTADYNGGLIVGAEALAAAMKESPEYGEYIAAYNKLSLEEIERLRSFKQIESRLPLSGRMSFEEEKRIGNLYTLLTLNKNIKVFIEKEREVCAILARVFDIIGDIHLFMFE
ncbi:MAG: YlbF family regulator [Clostridiales bacterium]|nr:YlbF family regulator [Clostridiales bacterium]